MSDKQTRVHTVEPDVVLEGAGLEFHTRRAEFLPMIAAVTEEAADG